MGSDSEIKITSIDFGIGQYSIGFVNLAANAIHIDADNAYSYLPFIQYMGKDISGYPTWYIPNFKHTDIPQDQINVPQTDMSFNDNFTMNIKGFYF